MKTPRALSAGPAAPIALLLCALAGGCGPGEGQAAPPAANPARDVQDLVTALTPPDATALPVEKSSFYQNRKASLERLREGTREHGLEALRVFRQQPGLLPEVRSGLLDVAAHTAPDAVEDLLVQLATTFGEDLYVRTQAALLLGECVPVRAIDEFETLITHGADGRTYPPEERLLTAWISAYEALDLDPVPVLASVATDIRRTQDVRHLAAKTLGRHPSVQGRQALETLMIESTGNGYIRRLAVRSLRDTLPAEEFCEIARRVQSREADTDFIVFLESAIDKNCR